MTTRVLHILGRMQRGGTEMRMLEVMKELRPQGFICDVVALSGLPGELDGAVEALGGRVHLCRRSLGWRRRFRQVLQQGGYAVVHSHVHLYSGVLLAIAARCGIPIRIAHFRSTSDGMGNNLIRRCYRWWMTKLIDRHATAILAVSRSALLESWPRRDDARCQIVYNGLDLSLFSGEVDVAALRSVIGIPTRSGKVVMHVGNFIPPKNHEFLIRVFAELAKQDQSVHLVLVGRGGTEEEQRARALIDQGNLGDRVTLLGMRQDVPRLLRCADVFLFPSVLEGLPGALLEACAAGLPCIASDIGPCREVAERIPLVRCLPLGEPVTTWASALSGSLGQQERLSPAEAGRLMVAGGFDVAGSSRHYALAWRGQSR